jgi:hypothetical protein
MSSRLHVGIVALVALCLAQGVHSQDWTHSFFTYGYNGPSAGWITTTLDHKVFVSTSPGGLLYSSDDGTNWTSLGLRDMDIREMAVAKNGSLLVTGPGVYRSTDAGTTWSISSSGITVSRTRAIAVNSSGTLFVASYLGGVFKSTNNGSTWAAINSGMPDYDDFDLQVKEPNLLFLGTGTSGVYRSTDEGSTWVQTASGMSYLNISSLALSANGTLYAGTWDQSTVYKSTNNGTTWASASAGLTGGSVSGLAASGDILYGCTADGVFRSTNEGTSWSLVDNTYDRTVIQKLAVTQDGHLIATGANGAILISRDIITGTGIAFGKTQPLTFRVLQNYPNPFNPATNLPYDLPTRGRVSVIVYDVQGREVRTLIDQEQEAGMHSVQWEGTNDRNQHIASGTYYAKVIFNDAIQTIRLLMLK